MEILFRILTIKLGHFLALSARKSRCHCNTHVRSEKSEECFVVLVEKAKETFPDCDKNSLNLILNHFWLELKMLQSSKTRRALDALSSPAQTNFVTLALRQPRVREVLQGTSSSKRCNSKLSQFVFLDKEHKIHWLKKLKSGPYGYQIYLYGGIFLWIRKAFFGFFYL